MGLEVLDFRVSRVGEPDVVVGSEEGWEEVAVSEGVLRVGRNYFAPGVWTSCLEVNPVVDDV